MSSSTAVVVLALVAAAMALFALSVYRRTAEERAARREALRRADLSDNLQTLTAALSRARRTVEILDACLPEMLHGVNGAVGAVALLLDNETDAAQVVRTAGCGDISPRTGAFPLAACPALEQSIARQEIANLGPLRSASDADAADPAIRFVAEQPGAVAVPLATSRRPIGVALLAFTEPKTLSPDSLEFLRVAGRRVTEAYLRAQAYEAAERARVDAEQLRARANRELHEREKAEAALRESETRYRALAARTSRLYALSAALSQSITLAAVAAAVVRYGRVVVGASAGSIALVEFGEFETLYAEEYPPDSAAAMRRFPAERGLCATAAVERREPIFVGSFAECQDQYWQSASIAADGGFASAAALPLVVEGKPIGVLTFHFTAPVHFDEEYAALLVSVAQHCAQAIDRARLYETAQHARTEAEQANRSKDDFLSIVSHELRTPLTAVLGWAAMLRGGGLEASRVTRAVEAIYTNATRQAQMIDELLDVSRIVGGRAALDIQELDLSDSIRGAIEAIMPLAAAKGLELRLGVYPSVPVAADPRRLEQILLNLLTNAVKFTPAEGSIAVDVAMSPRTVDVRVSDTGAGIEPEFLPHVFEQFRQAEHPTARSVGGLGLGLFIARQLVEAQGGSIRAESDGPGTGANFVVTLPIRTSAAPKVAAPVPARAPEPPKDTTPAPPSLDGVRVLLVDDEADLRELMIAALEKSGAKITAVGSARDALEVIDASEVDVLLADIAMPEVDGYDLIRAVRARPPHRNANVPAIAVTACARADERQRALAAGFQLHVAKPLDPAALVDTVARLYHTRPMAC